MPNKPLTTSDAVSHKISLPERRTEGLDIVEDAFPLVEGPIAVKLPNAPTSVTLDPMDRRSILSIRTAMRM